MHRQIASTGDVIDGRYRIEARLGKGGFARVYRAVDFKTGRPIALKLLRGGMIEDTTPLVRFMKEGNILARLGAHPNVIQVYDAGLSEDEDPFIAMELLDGLTLTSYIKDAAPVPWDAALGFMSQVADGLEHAHAAGIIHRDLKPANILLTEDAHGVVIPKLVDFGIAKVLETAMDQSVTRVGTPAYCAPEQLGSGLRRASSRVGIKVARGLSPATDVWPFGLITYELLTGLDVTQYWGAPNLTNILMKSALEPREKPSKVAGNQRIYLPPEFDEWFMRCLEPNAEDRFKTPAAAVDALAGLLDLTVDDVPTLGPESPQLRAAERELLAIALAAADKAAADKDAAAPTIPRPDLAKHRIVMDSTTTEAQDDESTAEVTQRRGPRDREPSLPGITLDDDAAAEAPPVPQSVGPSSADDAPGLERKRVDPVSEELSWGLPEGDDSPGDTPFSEDLLARLALDEESETPPSVPPTASREPGDATESGDAPPMSSAVPSSSDDGEVGGGAVPSGVAEPSSDGDEDSGDGRAAVAPATERMAPEELNPPTEVMAPEEIEPPTRRLPSKSRRSSSMVPYAIGAMLVGGVAAMVWDRVTAGADSDPSQVDAGAPAETDAAPKRPTATAGPTVAPPLPLVPTSTADPTADPSAEPEPLDEDQPAGVPTGSVPEAPPDETAEPSAEPPPPPPPPRPRPRWRPPPTKYVPPGI